MDKRRRTDITMDKRRSTDNTKAKRKMIKRQTIVDKPPHSKAKD
jgi:hypothetical protein